MRPSHLMSSSLGAGLLALLSAVPAQAQSQPNDAQCLLVSNLFTKAGDENSKATAMQASYFYLGRMTGTSAQIEARLVAEAPNITAANNAAIMSACVKAMLLRVEELSGMSVRLGAPQGG